MTIRLGSVDLAIIGSGFGGIGAAVMAKELGIDSYVVLERANAVGGTWRDNTYPGCACDIPSHLYSFSFAQNPDWTRSYPAQPEIEDYLESVKDRYRLETRIRYGFDVETLCWIDREQLWELTSRKGEVLRAAAVISATGPLSQPSVPAFDGLESFAGAAFHSAQWRHDLVLDGKRVGIIGTGASAIQIVPAIAERVEHLAVFQRTPPWVLPRDDRPAPGWRRRLYRRIPLLQRLHRWRIYCRQELLALAFLGKGRIAKGMTKRIVEETKGQIDLVISDPATAAALLPDFTPGCKRLLLSSDWYASLERSNVELVSTPIDRITPGGVATVDGVEHPLDILILATGFAVSDFPSPLTIIGEHGEDLRDHWASGASTDFGLTVSGFPNLWFLAGPGTGLGHNSIVFMIEAQLKQISGALAFMRRSSVSTINLRPEIEAASYQELQRRIASTVWTSGCSSWYIGSEGRVDTIWPGTTTEYWWRVRRFDPRRYRLIPGRFGALSPSR